LVIGYVMAGQWSVFVAVFIALLACLFAFQGSAALVGFVCLAAVGLLTGALPFLMILGATLALAGWDLARFDHILKNSSSTETVNRLEVKHYKSLVMAIGLGLLIAVTGRMIHFQIPFGVMALLAILALLSLQRVWQMHS
jgi:hypothetical protein